MLATHFKLTELCKLKLTTFDLVKIHFICKTDFQKQDGSCLNDCCYRYNRMNRHK